MMKPVHVILLCCAMLAGCGKSEAPAGGSGSEQKVEMGPYGPAFGVLAPVVRTVTVQTSGAITGTFSGRKGEEQTGLRGLCNPETWANFSLSMPGGEQFDEVWVTNMSKGPIPTGATGTFRLDYLEVTFSKSGPDYTVTQREFRGPGTMTLTRHDADPDHRRMIGTMTGTGLKGKGDDAGKTLDVQVSFDMDSSCGVK